MAAQQQQPTLYMWPEAWGLASASPACLQVEAYMRLTRTGFHVQPCSTPSKSPTGMLPALEQGTAIAPGSPNEFLAARQAIQLAKSSIKDLDAALGPAQRAALLAFTALVQQRLEVATEFTIWCERHGYREYTAAAFSGQPFPLNHLVPWSMRREALRRYRGLKSEEVYAGACEVLGAVADQLSGNAPGHRYLLGAQPCSLDALLLGHLLFYRGSPAAAPVLRQKVTSTPALCRYLDHAVAQLLSGPLPTGAAPAPSPAGAAQQQQQQQQRAQQAGGSGAPGGDGASTSGSFAWSEAAKGQGQPSKPSESTPAELEFRRKSWWWLAGAALTTVGYIVFSNRYFTVEQLQQMLGQDGDDDDDGGDADDDDGGMDDE